MFFQSGFAGALFISGMLIAGQPSLMGEQESANHSNVVAVVDLPDAPQPQNQSGTQTNQTGTSQPSGSGTSSSGSEDQNSRPAPTPPGGATDQQQEKSSTQAGHSATVTVPPATDEQKANEQIKEQEKQRILGIVPTFNITYLGSQTVSLTAKQKFDIAIHTTIDPASFVIPFFVAGYNELEDDDKGFPWGIKGLGERAGAAYLDAFDGDMLGNAILPSILHQDPRYYRLGHGTVAHRILYAAATSFVCKHDKTGKWEPNYSNVGGNILSGAISNLYYPSRDSGAGLAISNGLIVTAEGALGAEFNEFWPDISRHFLHRDPTHGLDAQMKDQDEKKKAERKKQ